MKKYFAGIIAIILAIGMSAFTAPKSPPPDGYYWYDADYGYLMSPLKSDIPPNSCPLNGGDLCAYGHYQQTDRPFFNADIHAKFPW